MTEKGQNIISLRKQGKTYSEIAQILNIPKSTVAWWLKNVKISKILKEHILKRAKEKWSRNLIIYNKLRVQKAAKIHEDIIEKASKEIKKISFEDLKLIGSALYWAEGNKKYKWDLRFGNSDPDIIKVIMRFFRNICLIPENKIKARIHLYPSINPEEATVYWMKITKLPRSQFKKPQTQISRRSKGKRPMNTLPYGTLHLTAGNTEIASKVKGWIRGVAENFKKIR